MSRSDPYAQMRFLLEIDDVVTAGFSRCTLPTSSTDVIEYREGNEPPTPRKLPGLTTYGPLVLETGVTDESIELFEWRSLVEQGAIAAARRSIGVVLLDAAGNSAAYWRFREAWPAAYEAPRLSATASEVAIERLVVAHEGFGRVDITSAVDDGERRDEGTSVAHLPTGDLPRVTWTPQTLGDLPLSTPESPDDPETSEET